MKSTALAATALAALALTGCASTTSQTPAKQIGQELRDMDTAAHLPGIGTMADYDAAFNTLSSRCTEQGAGLGNEVQAVLGLLQKSNISDENRLTVMQHLAASIPAGGQKMNCADIGGAYVTLRQGQG